jgi:anti-sigma factor RsiW
MRCPHKKKLSAYQDGELSDSETRQIQRHLQECARCRRELAMLSTVGEALAYIESPEPNPFLATRITSHLRERTPVSVLRRWALAGSAAVLAGTSMFLGGCLGHNLYSQLTSQKKATEVAGDYLGTPALQDFPQNSFGDTFEDMLEGGD